MLPVVPPLAHTPILQICQKMHQVLTPMGVKSEQSSTLVSEQVGGSHSKQNSWPKFYNQQEINSLTTVFLVFVSLVLTHTHTNLQYMY